MTDHLPDDLEGRVRDAYRSAAWTVQTLQRPAPTLAAGSVPRRRRMNALVPLAAATVVIVAIGASLALPRLLTGASQHPAATRISAPAPEHYPPFRVVVTANDNNRKSMLLVEAAATGHVVSQLAPPWHGAMWLDVAATANATRFIAAAIPLSSPYAPSRLYALTLSARGAVTGLTALPGSPLPGQLISLAASADGSTVAFMTLGTGGTYETGVITGGRTRQWSLSPGAGIGIRDISVSSDGDMIAFISTSQSRAGVENAAWVLATGSAPGSLTARARKVYDHTYVGGAGHTMTILESALISPDARTLYLSTAATSASGKTVTDVTAYSTAGQASRRTIATWEGGYPALTPVGGRLLISDLGSFEPQPGAPGGGTSDPTAFLVNPATLTRTTLQLRGIPRAQYLTLAW